MANMRVNAVILGPEGKMMFPVQLEHIPRVGELIAIEGMGGFCVIQVLHAFGPDEEGTLRQVMTVFVDPSQSRFLPFTAEVSRP